MMVFMKEFNSFKDGVTELSKLSFSADQSLKWQTGKIPVTEEDAVKSLALNVAFDRPTGNGVDWSQCEIDITAYGVRYSTCSGLKFGWETVLGANAFDTFDGEFVFFIAHPEANEEQAAPKESTLKKSAESFGWEEKNEDIFHLAGATKFI